MWEGVARKIHGWQQTDFFPGIRRICIVIRFMYVQFFDFKLKKRLKEKRCLLLHDAKKLIFFEIVGIHEIDQNTNYDPVF